MFKNKSEQIKTNSSKDELMRINEKINTIELDMSELKNSIANVDEELTQSVKLLQSEIKDVKQINSELKDQLNLFNDKLNDNQSAMKTTIGAEIDEASKIRSIHESVSEFRSEMERMANKIKQFEIDIAGLNKKEVSIQYDSGLETLKDDFEKFKKIALTVDDKI